MAGGKKSIGKALQLVEFLSFLYSRTNETQAVPLENKIGPPFTSPHGELGVDHRQTNRHTGTLSDCCGTIRAPVTSRRMRLFSVIKETMASEELNYHTASNANNHDRIGYNSK